MTESFLSLRFFVRSAVGKAEPLTATTWSRILDVASDLEETLDAADLEAIEFRDRLAAHKALLDRRRPVDIVDASVGESKEALRLLRSRLAAVTFALSIAFSIFAVWLTIGQITGMVDDGWPWLVAEYGLTTFFIGTAIWLRGPSEMSTFCARSIELLVFGLPAIFFGAHTARALIDSIHSGSGIVPVTLQGWVLLIFAHAIFIPNPWRRAALVSVSLAAMPLLVTVLTGVFDLPTRKVLLENPSALIDMTLALSAMAAVAIIGVRTINFMRTEIFEAKQFGRYRLRELLGSGGMGEVYLAEHQLLRRPCAIKIIRPERAGDAKMLARFEREVQATAKLSHWNSVYIYDYGHTADGTLYYVMEYLPG